MKILAFLKLLISLILLVFFCVVESPALNNLFSIQFNEFSYWIVISIPLGIIIVSLLSNSKPISIGVNVLYFFLIVLSYKNSIDNSVSQAVQLVQDNNNKIIKEKISKIKRSYFDCSNLDPEPKQICSKRNSIELTKYNETLLNISREVELNSPSPNYSKSISILGIGCILSGFYSIINYVLLYSIKENYKFLSPKTKLELRLEVINLSNQINPKTKRLYSEREIEKILKISRHQIRKITSQPVVNQQSTSRQPELKTI